MEDGLYQNLMHQLQRWRRRHNRKSYKTRERYDASLNVFLRFLADHFHLQKLANIKPKHLVAFVEHRISEGISASTIATDLSSIRLFLDLYDDLRVNPDEFPSNEELRKSHDMTTRHFGGVIRAWTMDEFQIICTIAENLGRPIVAQTLGLAFWLGLRLHEVMQIDHDVSQTRLAADTLRLKEKEISGATFLFVMKHGQFCFKHENALHEVTVHLWRRIEPLTFKWTPFSTSSAITGAKLIQTAQFHERKCFSWLNWKQDR